MNKGNLETLMTNRQISKLMTKTTLVSPKGADKSIVQSKQLILPKLNLTKMIATKSQPASNRSQKPHPTLGCSMEAAMVSRNLKSFYSHLNINEVHNYDPFLNPMSNKEVKTKLNIGQSSSLKSLRNNGVKIFNGASRIRKVTNSEALLNIREPVRKIK